MRSATLAKLALTATVGIGALVGQAAIAQAGPAPLGPSSFEVGPHPDPTIPPIKGNKVTPPTTVDPGGVIVLPEPDPQPDPPFDPQPPIAQPTGDACNLPSCDKVGPQGDPDPDPKPGCNKLLASCDKITSDPGCTLTHGCPGEDPEPDPEPCRSDLGARTQCEPPTTDGGGDGGTDGGGDGGTDGGTTTGGGTTGGDHGGKLPHTGVDAMAMVGLGLGLGGVGAALKLLGRRKKDQDQEPTPAF
jgi:LPXTG-motif cell wall-anchored protein